MGAGLQPVSGEELAAAGALLDQGSGVKFRGGLLVVLAGVPDDMFEGAAGVSPIRRSTLSMER